jgi:RimJ/RimL family protein N-acetyltransferase
MLETIRTERLTLRPLRLSDAGPISLHASDPRVARMTASIPHPFPPGAAEAFIEGTNSGRRAEEVWAVDATPSDGEELIGVIGFKPGPAEIGYWVGPPYWGSGYATEAVTAMVSHLLSARGLARVEATVFTDNAASGAVLAKAGFREVGTESGFSVARGQPVALWRFRIEAQDTPEPLEPQGGTG